jgi:hypothetical protein
LRLRWKLQLWLQLSPPVTPQHPLKKKKQSAK